MARLEDKRTPVTEGEVYTALGGAWQTEFGSAAPRSSLLVLLSQWALETGRGHSMHCFNLGNVKSRQQTGDWCFFRCNEVINGKIVWFDPDDPACCFRAFNTLADGALDYLHTLRSRFSAAWPAVLNGDPAGFSHLLKLSRYYTADEHQYTQTLVSLFSEFNRTIATAPLPPPAGPAQQLPDLFTLAGIQQALIALGFDPGKPDGLAGPNTQAAVRAFQSQQGLANDGVVGRITRAALAKAWAAKMLDG
jgi:hypothetical protein